VHGEGYVAWIQLTPASGSGTVVVGGVVVGVDGAVVLGGDEVVVAAVPTPIDHVDASAHATTAAVLALTSERGYRPVPCAVTDGRWR
jgi:hypothetical protein